MSTITKLNYTNETKDLIKDSLNQFGVGITDEDTFRSYVDKIKGIYNNWPKVTGTGTDLNLTPTKKAKMNIALGGNTEQTQYTGKNLVNNTAASKTNSGITYTVNDDGTVIANGTASSISLLNIIGNNTFVLPAGEYKITGCPTGGSDSTYRLDINNGAVHAQRDYGGGNTFTLSTDTTIDNVRIRIAGNATVNNLEFKPMIRLASIVDDTYEPYVGGTPSPNPNYPQTVHTVTGNNTVTVAGVNYPINLGTIELCKIGDYQNVIFKNTTDSEYYDSSLVENGWYYTPSFKQVIDNANDFERVMCENDSSKFYFRGISKLNNIEIINYNYTQQGFINYGKANYPARSTAKGIVQNFNLGAEHIYFYTDEDSTLTLEEFKEKWNAKLSNTPLVIIAKANSNIPIQITDTTLIAQLEAIYLAKSAEGTTNISQTNNDLPFILNVSALKGGN